MTVTTKPKHKKQPDEEKVQALIRKGGSVATTQTEDEPKFSSVLLRIPVDMLQEIDESVLTFSKYSYDILLKVYRLNDVFKRRASFFECVPPDLLGI
jgi:hypothetical protein